MAFKFLSPFLGSKGILKGGAGMIGKENALEDGRSVIIIMATNTAPPTSKEDAHWNWTLIRRPDLAFILVIVVEKYAICVST